MPRKKKKPLYDPEASMEELLKALVKDYGSYDDRKSKGEHKPSLNSIAAEHGINPLKARKLLITAGVYSTTNTRRIDSYVSEGKTVDEIMELMNLSRASVNSYLPYKDAAYKMPESSVDADRAKSYRLRSRTVGGLKKCIEQAAGEIGIEKQLLWKCVEVFEGYRFETAKGLPFTYEIKRNRDDGMGGEMFFSRKTKGVTRATVELAYDRVVAAREKQGTDVPVMNSPKRLNVFGASYLYPMFIRFGIVEARG